MHRRHSFSSHNCSFRRFLLWDSTGFYQTQLMTLGTRCLYPGRGFTKLTSSSIFSLKTAVVMSYLWTLGYIFMVSECMVINLRLKRWVCGCVIVKFLSLHVALQEQSFLNFNITRLIVFQFKHPIRVCMFLIGWCFELIEYFELPYGWHLVITWIFQSSAWKVELACLNVISGFNFLHIQVAFCWVFLFNFV